MHLRRRTLMAGAGALGTGIALRQARAQSGPVRIGFVSPLSGPGYTASKHGVVAMSHSLNMEECINGIRSCVMCPGEVNTPILKKRPNPLSAEDLAKMVQPEDCGDLVRYIAVNPVVGVGHF